MHGAPLDENISFLHRRYTAVVQFHLQDTLHDQSHIQRLGAMRDLCGAGPDVDHAHVRATGFVDTDRLCVSQFLVSLDIRLGIEIRREGGAENFVEISSSIQVLPPRIVVSRVDGRLTLGIVRCDVDDGIVEARLERRGGSLGVRHSQLAVSIKCLIVGVILANPVESKGSFLRLWEMLDRFWTQIKGQGGNL